jgi:CMP-N-acetylneuraminic acid synthetase
VSAVAVVPARGGSKRLPRKNLRPLAGVSLLEHALACAARCPSLARTVVSTEDDEIAAVARAAGAEVVERSPALAADEATSWSVVRDVARALGAFDTLVLLQPTSPLRLPEDVEGALALLDADPAADGAFAVDADGAPTGVVYAWRRAFVEREPERWQNGRLLRYLPPPARSVDVDDAADLERAEALLRSGAVRLPWL